MNVLHATSQYGALGDKQRAIGLVRGPVASTLAEPAPGRRFRHDVESGICNLVAGDMTAGYHDVRTKARPVYTGRPGLAMDANGNLGSRRRSSGERAALCHGEKSNDPRAAIRIIEKLVWATIFKCRIWFDDPASYRCSSIEPIRITAFEDHSCYPLGERCDKFSLTGRKRHTKYLIQQVDSVSASGSGFRLRPA